MSLFNKEMNAVEHTHDQKCDRCACYQLRRLTPGAIVDVILDGVEFAGLVYACIDHKTCCATFLDDTSPFFVDCNQIDALRLVTVDAGA